MQQRRRYVIRSIAAGVLAAAVLVVPAAAIANAEGVHADDHVVGGGLAPTALPPVVELDAAVGAPADAAPAANRTPVPTPTPTPAAAADAAAADAPAPPAAEPPAAGAQPTPPPAAAGNARTTPATVIEEPHAEHATADMSTIATPATPTVSGGGSNHTEHAATTTGGGDAPTGELPFTGPGDTILLIALAGMFAPIGVLLYSAARRGDRRLALAMPRFEWADPARRLPAQHPLARVSDEWERQAFQWSDR